MPPITWTTTLGTIVLVIGIILRLLALGFKLPRYGADGDYGGETQSATAALIKSIYDGSFVDDHVLDLAKGMK